jgi:aminopeptidase N
VLRPHRIGIGVYDGDGTAELVRRVEVDLDPVADGGRTAVPGIVGAERGRLLLLNDGDLTFAKVRLDPHSLAGLPSVLPALADPLARAVVWAAAVDATRDADLAPAEFVALAAAGLPAETQVAVFADVLDFALTSAARQYLPAAGRASALSAIAGACLEVLNIAEPGSGRQLAAARGLVRSAGPAEAPALSEWLDGTGPGGLAIDADLRWALLHRLVVLGERGEDAIAAEVTRDPSAQGAEQATVCRAALPDGEAKARAWAVISCDDSLSVRIIAATAEGFWQAEQDELTAPYVARYFDEMPVMATRRGPSAVWQVGKAAYPRFAVSRETQALAEAMLARNGVDPVLQRIVVDATDELSRAATAREKFPE